VRRVVIVGGGGTGDAAAFALRKRGFDGDVTIVSADQDRPYDRPYLSKEFLRGEVELPKVFLHGEDEYEKQGIELRLNTRVTGGSLSERKLGLEGGVRHQAHDVMDEPRAVSRRDPVDEALRGRTVSFATQSPQLGTGHAVQMAWSEVEKGPDTLLVLAGDMPLIRTATLKRLLERHAREGNAVTFLSGVLDDPGGYGRVIKDGNGAFVKIVEERDATPEEKAVAEVNSGIYCFARAPLQEALGFLRADNRQSEYYLTDTLTFIQGRGGTIGVELCSDARELFGVNNPEQLALVEQALREWGSS